MEKQAVQHQTWWQKHSKLLMRTVLIALLAIVIVLIILIILGYIFNWDWTGLTATDKSKPTTNIIVYQPGKTLWDWLGLLGVLAIPVVVGFGAAWFTTQQSQAEADRAAQQVIESEANRQKRHDTDIEIANENREKQQQTDLRIAADNRQEAALRAYIDKISEILLEILLHDDMSHVNPEHVLSKVVRIRTLIVLPQLDIHRKRLVVQFLYESDLIKFSPSSPTISPIDLSGADLIKAYLSSLNLTRANLGRTILTGAELMGTILAGANLSNTTLIGANLTSADLTGANLKDASISLNNLAGMEPIITNLFNANLTDADLSGARLCGADLRDTILIGADLTGADLTGAKISDKQLAKTKSFKDATMQDGFIHR